MKVCLPSTNNNLAFLYYFFFVDHLTGICEWVCYKRSYCLICRLMSVDLDCKYKYLELL